MPRGHQHELTFPPLPFLQWLRETVAYVVEESIVDPKAQTIMSRTRNITLASYMCITEWNVFKPAAEYVWR